MTPEISIVEMNAGNTEELRELFLAVRQNTFRWLDTDAFSLLDFDKETAGEHVVVAVLGGRVVGFISIYLAENFVHHLFVDEGCQRLGVGTKLLNHAIDKTGFPLRLKCAEENKSAIEFYTKKGFHIKERGFTGRESYLVLELPQQEQTSM